MDTNHLTGQIGDHEMVLVVVALQSLTREAEDHDLMGHMTGTHTFGHGRTSYFDRAKILLRKSSILWKRLAGSTHIALSMIVSTAAGISGLSCRGGVGLPSTCWNKMAIGSSAT